MSYPFKIERTIPDSVDHILSIIRQDLLAVANNEKLNVKIELKVKAIRKKDKLGELPVVGVVYYNPDFNP